MSTNALGNNLVPGSLTVKNYGGTDIPAGTVVIADTSHVASMSGAPGVAIVAATASVAGTLGVTTTDIPAGGTGLIFTQGSIATCTAYGTVTYGTAVQCSNTASHLGQVATCGAATAQLGIALNTVSDGEQVSVLIALAKNA